MGTDLEMTVSTDDPARAKRAFDAAIAEMRRIEDEMSEWKKKTFVSEINRNAGKKAVAVPSDLFKVVWAAITVSDLSEGAFDISWAAMRGVWDFSKGHERVPSAEEVKDRLKLVNYKDIVLDEKKMTVFLKNEGMAIGLGAIAKGYAVDRAALLIAKEGIKDLIVKAGGDMRVQGLDNGKPWEIGIKHPRKKELLAKLSLTNVSISTSGDYERFFIKDKVLYHHIMDPRTGYPAKGSMSVTILAPDTMTSDALSTAVFVMGPDKGLELIKKLNGVEAIIVDSSGKMRISPGISLK
ncbi:MAG: FAD:protein FMN transferase [Deltaproteobacteria bacterium]|nr:FAD:protein FMN transferase [Deltaproteobacteria bacterium]